MKPAIVSVLLASLREREYLEQIRRKAQAEIKRLQAERVEPEKPRGKKVPGKEVKTPLRPAA
jgi:hypothetical protein